MSVWRALIAVLLVGAFVSSAPPAHGQNRGGRGAAPIVAARQSAPIDLTGNWVAYVTEDWRFRMMTPPNGDYSRVPLTPEGRKIADGWDPKADEAAGDQCKAYGAGAIMRLAARFRITWQDDSTLRVESDAGMQVRIFRFGPSEPAGERSWQGHSTARWDVARSLTVTTTHMRPGYLRRNGVPYSADATVTEYFDVAPYPFGGQLLIVTTVVEDPRFLQRPFVVSSHFKPDRDQSKWNPTPCSTTW